MDGIHDLGGKHGYGRVVREEDDAPFAARWEAAVFHMTQSGFRHGWYGNVDRFRHSIERIDPRAYLGHGYYGRWLGGIETMLVEAGICTTGALDELAAARGAGPDDLVAARPAQHPDKVATGERGSARDAGVAPGFAVGDVVLTARHPSAGHTRLPAYVRGCEGRIHRCHGSWVFPDSHAHGKGESPQTLYTVEFEGRELWGPDTDGSARVYIDLFEPYLTRRPA